MWFPSSPVGALLLSLCLLHQGSHHLLSISQLLLPLLRNDGAHVRPPRPQQGSQRRPPVTVLTWGRDTGMTGVTHTQLGAELPVVTASLPVDYLHSWCWPGFLLQGRRGTHEPGRRGWTEHLSITQVRLYTTNKVDSNRKRPQCVYRTQTFGVAGQTQVVHSALMDPQPVLRGHREPAAHTHTHTLVL